MNELSQFLVESILGEADSVDNVVVVYAGRFQPFHKGHYATYSHLVKKFGKNNVFIGTSDKTDNQKSPFNFKEKQLIITKMFGIPSNRIVNVKNPYAPTEVLNKFDEKTTAFVTVVGEKDSSRLGGKYFEKYKDNTEFQGYKDKGYVYIAPAQSNPISGTDVRIGLRKGSKEDKKNFFVKRAYGKYDDKIFNLIVGKLSSLPEVSEQNIWIPKQMVEEWLVNNSDLIIEASATTTTGGDVDDGPNFFFPSFASFNKISEKRAIQVGYMVLSQIMSDELTDIDPHPIYPKGPVKAVTPFPAGVIGKITATNQKDFYGNQAYPKWFNHVTRAAALVGYSLVDSILTQKDKKEALKIRKIPSLPLPIVDENIDIPVKVGDTILTGKFKNKKTVVKDIGKDEHGMPTINGKKVVTFRMVNEGKYVIFEGEKDDEKYTHIGYGKYKEKGKEKNSNAPTFKKDDSGKYVAIDDTDSSKPKQTQAGAVQGTDMFNHAPDVQKQSQSKETDWTGGKDGWEILDDDRSKVKNIRKYTDKEYGEETGEYFENETTQKVAPNAFKDEADMIQKMKAAKPIFLSSEKMQNMSNTDVGEILDASEDGGKESMQKLGKEKAQGYGKDWERLEAGIASNSPVPAPMALRDKNGNLHLLAGNTRLMSFTASGKKLPIKVIDYDGEFQYNESLSEEKLNEIPMADLQQIDKYADKQLNPIDVVLTDRHFFERLTDPRNDKPISAAELTGFFKRIAKNKKKFLEFLEQYGQIVAKDNRTNINIPFMKQANKVIAKTVMRKDNYMTSNPIYKFENIGEASDIGGLGSGNNSARWTAPGQSKKLNIAQLSGYEQTKFPTADELDISNEKYNWDGISNLKKYHNKVRAVRKSDGSLVFENKIPGGLSQGMDITDIANKHKVDIDDLAKELQDGIKVELEHTTDRKVAEEIALDHLFEDPKYYTKLQSIENPKNEYVMYRTHIMKPVDKGGMGDEINELTKGELFGGKIKIGGVSVPLKVELLGADNKKKVFITRVINIDKKYLSKLPSNGILEIPARIFRTPGGGWYKIKTPKAFENLMFGYPDQKWVDDHEKELKRLRGKFNKEKGKDQYYEPALGGGLTEGVVADGEPETGYIPDGKTRNVGSDAGRPEPWFEQGGYSQLHFPKADAMRGRGKGKDTESSFRKVVYKTTNVKVSTLKKALKSVGSDDWVEVPLNEGLLTEGGAYGHMNHPFDTEINLTFGQLKDIVNKALEGNLELTREKTDGQALAISWVNGRLVAARNKGHLKNKGAGALDINGVAMKFAGRGELEKAYNFAMKDLSNAISKLSEKQREKIFKGGSCFMNLEVIYPTSVNVIPYGQALLVFHGTMEYNEEGIAIGENQEAAKILAGMIKQVNQQVQSAYTIQGPPVTQLPKSQNLSSLKGKYNGQISKLQSQFKLKDNDGIADYHQAWWTDFVTKKSPSTLDNKTLMGLVQRWAFYDKSFRLDKKNISDEKVLAWAQGIDKNDHAKMAKDNIRPFEDIFLGIGADILSFMSSVLAANPDKAVRDMKKRLDQTIKDVQKSGDEKKIAKLKLELQRLNAIGGKDKIVPNEGIVFVYNGKTFKLTGTFAPLNQILGLFYE